MNNVSTKETQIVDIINQPSRKEQFGMIVRMERIKQQHSLRSLAEKINISHAFLRKIELSQTSISKGVCDYLVRELGLRIKYDEQEEARFRALYRDFYNSILYYDVPKSEETLRTLQSKAVYYEKTLWKIDFLILQLGYLNFIRNMDYSKSNEIYRNLLSIKDLMSNEQRQIFLNFAGAFFYHISDINMALKLFTESKQYNVLNHLNGMTEYLIGRCYSVRHHFAKANRHLQIAHTVFKVNNNYIRTAYAKLISDVHELLLNKRNDLKQIELRTHTFTNQYKLTGVENKVNYLLMMYHYRNENLDEALMKLQKSKSKNMRNFYYKAMIYLKLGNKTSALKALSTGRNVAKSPIRNALLYKYGFDFIEAYYENNEKTYESALSHFFNEAMHQAFYQEGKDAYRFYVEYLKRKRKYKHAFQLTQTFTTLALQARH
ncbi:MAG: helix-turn-helix domain-containing protein [Bacillota bacterium]